MKTNLVILFLTVSLPMAYGQQGNVTAGGNSSGSGGNSSYSVGQIVYTTIASSSGTVIQGVQQPYEITTLDDGDFDQIDLKMKVYPNPTVAKIFLSVGDANLEKMSFKLYDINGKELLADLIQFDLSEIQMDRFPSGVYVLHVLNADTKIKSFKIVKN